VQRFIVLSHLNYSFCLKNKCPSIIGRVGRIVRGV
jgi:hypothetical protein